MMQKTGLALLLGGSLALGGCVSGSEEQQTSRSQAFNAQFSAMQTGPNIYRFEPWFLRKEAIYTWDLGDGVTRKGVYQTKLYSQTPIRQYYTVTLHIALGEQEAESSQSITVEPLRGFDQDLFSPMHRRRLYPK